MGARFYSCQRCGNAGEGEAIYRCTNWDCGGLFCGVCRGAPKTFLAKTAKVMATLAQASGAGELPEPYCPDCGWLGRAVAEIQPRFIDEL